MTDPIRAEATRRAFAAISETCPIVDAFEFECLDKIKLDLDHDWNEIRGDKYISAHIGDLTDNIKSHATEELREQLILAYMRVVELEAAA